LNYHREKLGFQDEKAFRVLEAQHQKEYPSLIEKNKQQRRALNQERDVLQNAQNALERRFVRQVAANIQTTLKWLIWALKRLD